MRNIFSLLLALMTVCSVEAQAPVQLEISDPSVVDQKGEFYVDLFVSDFQSIRKGTIQVHWRMDLELIALEDLAFPNMTIEEGQGVWLISLPQGPGRSLSSPSKLCRIRLSTARFSSFVCFAGGGFENVNGNPVEVEANNECGDFVDLIQRCQLKVDTLEISVLTTGFTNITGVQFSMDWNADDYEFVDAIELNPDLPGFLPSSTNSPRPGEFRVVWDRRQGGGSTLPQNSRLFTLRLLQKRTPVDLVTFSKTLEIEIIDTNVDVLPVRSFLCNSIRLGEVEGQVSVVENDCVTNKWNFAMKGRTVRFVETTKGYAYYTYTSEDGSFFKFLPLGDYDVSVLTGSNVWNSCGPQTVSVDSSSVSKIDFGVYTDLNCPEMKVDVHRSFLRRCFDNTYTINYGNQGSITAKDAYILFELDPYMTYVSSSVPATMVTSNVYRMELGDVDVFENGSIEFTVNLNCDSTIIGQTHCVEATVFPDTICRPLDLRWSGASIETEATCIGDSVEFTVTNTGNVSSENLQFIIVEDDIGFMKTKHVVGPQESISMRFLGEGKTWRIIHDQESYHPGISTPTSAIEGCTDFSGNPSLGFMTRFAENDGNPFVDIDCQQSIGSFDPNDKLVYPQGKGVDGNIDKEQKLTYTIRFQNTGTDTAFTVVIVDTITTALDLESFQLLSSSHPVAVESNDGRVLQFRFDNILLPDSTTNEAESHGFVKFEMYPSQDIERGDAIENKAGIYFDFNEPIVTNTTLNTIAPLIITSVEDPSGDASTVMQIFPNPASQEVQLNWNSIGPSEKVITIMDNSGKEWGHWIVPHGREQYVIDVASLLSGVYLLRVEHADGDVQQAKMVIIR